MVKKILLSFSNTQDCFTSCFYCENLLWSNPNFLWQILHRVFWHRKKRHPIFLFAEFVWSQEEHQNCGAWSFVQPRFANLIGIRNLSYAGRSVLCQPAVGVGQVHQREIAQLMEMTFQKIRWFINELKCILVDTQYSFFLDIIWDVEKNIALLKVLVNLSRSKKKCDRYISWWSEIVANTMTEKCIAFLIFCPRHRCRKDEMLCKDRCQIGNSGKHVIGKEWSKSRFGFLSLWLFLCFRKYFSWLSPTFIQFDILKMKTWLKCIPRLCEQWMYECHEQKRLSQQCIIAAAESI